MIIKKKFKYLSYLNFIHFIINFRNLVLNDIFIISFQSKSNFVLILLNENYLQVLEKIATSNHWITLVLMFLLFGLVLLKAISSKRLNRSLYSLFNKNLINIESKESTSFFDVFQIVFFLFSAIVISLLVFNFNKRHPIRRKSTLETRLNF